MIHFICALKCEAKPLIQHFKLAHNNSSGLFNNYLNDEITLTITGIGKLAAAAGTMYVIKEYNSNKSDIWLNTGIAGHRTLAIGQTVLANKITDAGSGASWYPQIVFTTGLPATGLNTKDKAATTYDDDMVDMEAAGFYATAIRSGTAELVHSIKVISDNEANPVDKISEPMATELISNSIKDIETVVENLREIADELAETGRTPAHFESFIQQRHFTRYQKGTLDELLRRWQVLQPDQNPLELLKDRNSADAILAELENILADTTISFPIKHD